MKRCANPQCRSDFLFGADKSNCPFCHSVLVDTSEAVGRQPFISPDTPFTPETAPEDPGAFLQRSGGEIRCTGQIVEIDHAEFFYGKKHKLMNSLFRGEPYQLAHQTVEYTIRVEALGNRVPAPVTDFCLYGNYLGRLQVGDEVQVRAKAHRSRNVVKAIFDATTGTPVRPGFQLPAWSIRAAAAALLFLVLALLYAIVSGAAAKFVLGLLGALLPVLLIIVGVLYCLSGILPHRRR